MGILKSEVHPLVTPQGARLCRIERALRSRGHADFEYLRRCVGMVSPATLKRDLQLMREELGAPLHYVCRQGYALVGAWPGVMATIYEQLQAR